MGPPESAVDRGSIPTLERPPPNALSGSGPPHRGGDPRARRTRATARGDLRARRPDPDRRATAAPPVAPRGHTRSRGWPRTDTPDLVIRTASLADRRPPVIGWAA
ncbi:hypothetical protein GCM10009830_41020 [Glycomyces endophyticus]|uniref:Uncharacterized protein n=1 Tax=Glycomyces endophyticus TaxID=480996 RepID=A0ABN2HJV5_9ACTN